MSYVTKQKQENIMKHVSFALILVLLSFGLSYGLVIDANIPTLHNGNHINTNSAFTDEFTVNCAGEQAPPNQRLAWSSPFLFYGINGLPNLDDSGILVRDASFDGIWDMGCV